MTEFKISTDACDVLWQHWSPWEHQIWSWVCRPDLQLWSVISAALTSLNTRTEGTFCGRWSVSDDHFDYHSIFCVVSSIRVESSTSAILLRWSMDISDAWNKDFYDKILQILYMIMWAHSVHKLLGDKILRASQCKIVSARFILSWPLKHWYSITKNR